MNTVTNPSVLPPGTSKTPNQASLTGAGVTTTDGATKDLAKNFDNFLTLLTTQLKNQDPLKPMDSTEFTTQLVQFTGVEQQINVNKNLEKLLGLQQSNQALNAASFIDRQVEAKGNGLTFGTDGAPAAFIYDLAASAQNASVSIKDVDGNVIRAFAVSIEKGRNVGTWDGRTTSGQVAPPGFYTFQVSASDATGQPIQATHKQTGVVTDVTIEDGVTYLQLNGKKVSIDDITKVTRV
jgi:flagellar basal-body rod modification protein FlgD